MPIEPTHAALLVVDVQNYCAHPDGGGSHKLDAQQRHHLFHSLHETVLPNLQLLQSACRRAHIGRLRGRREHDPRRLRPQPRLKDFGDRRAARLKIAPAEDEMIFRKTSSSVFISANIDYVLRNLEVRSLIVAGMMTDQCVESAVRDACDLGYLVTLASDACTTDSAERHEQSLLGIRGYCRQRRTDQLFAEIAAFSDSC